MGLHSSYSLLSTQHTAHTSEKTKAMAALTYAMPNSDELFAVTELLTKAGEKAEAEARKKAEAIAVNFIIGPIETAAVVLERRLSCVWREGRAR